MCAKLIKKQEDADRLFKIGTADKISFAGN